MDTETVDGKERGIVMLPLTSPLSLPAGIVGKINLGTAGLLVLLHEVAKGDNDVLVVVALVVKAWLAAAAQFADNVAIEVLCHSALVDSLRVPPSDLVRRVFYQSTCEKTCGGVWN